VSVAQPKILVIRGGAIGDFILTLPAIAALRRLALAGGLVDRVQPIEARGLAGFFARDGELEPGLMDYFSEFDLVVSYLYDPDEIFKTNVGRCSVGQFIGGPHRPDEEAGVHATQVYLKPLERLAIFDADPVPRLVLGNRSPAPGCRVALHPGSGSEKKNWPEDKWTELSREILAETDWDVMLVGGEAEGERLRRMAGALPSPRVRVAQAWPLPELGEQLQACAAFAGHDSGITHLAAALGTPCVVLWSDTVQEVWRPRSDRLALLEASAGIQNIEASQVLEELRRLVRIPPS